MAENVIVEYGGSGLGSIGPLPLISFGKSYDTTEDGTVIGADWTMELQGWAIDLDDTGIDTVFSRIDEYRTLWAKQNARFEIKCGQNKIFECFPTILNFNVDQGNNQFVENTQWFCTLSFPQEENLAEDASLQDPAIKSFNESWRIEPLEEQKFWSWTLPDEETSLDQPSDIFRLSHQVSCVGKRVFNQDGLVEEAWESARRYITENKKLDLDGNMIEASGVINLNAQNFTEFNSIRTQEINENAGSISIEESLILMNPSGDGVPGKAIENFTTQVRQGLNSPLTTVSIQGQVRGLEERSYGSSPGDYTINVTADQNSRDAWNNGIKTRLYGRAKFAGASLARNTLNPIPVEEIYGYNPQAGIVNYSYTYDDHVFCITNAISENITINEQKKIPDRPIFLTILGRGNDGTLMQSIGTATHDTVSCSIDAVVPHFTGQCISDTNTAKEVADDNFTPNTDVWIQNLEAHYSGSYSTIFRTRDDTSWQLNAGLYHRTVEWVLGDCN